MRRAARLWDLALMVGLLVLTYLLLPTPAWAAPILTWDAVTTGTDGLPLGPGLEVTEYRVYQCSPGVGACTRATAVQIGGVFAPLTEFDLVGQPVPSVYVVTAVNKAGESGESAPLKVVPPDVPRGERLK